MIDELFLKLKMIFECILCFNKLCNYSWYYEFKVKLNISHLIWLLFYVMFGFKIVVFLIR